MAELVVNPQIVDSVTGTNMKTVGEQAAFQMGLAMGNSIMNQKLMDTNAIANQQNVQTLAQLALANAIKGIGEDVNEKTPTNAVSDVKTLEANLAPRLADLGSAVAAIQQLLKGAQTTLPESGLTTPK